jgi:hypothetical protein
VAVREILKMGDARLLRVAQPVREFDTDEVHLLVSDMFDTMRAVNGAGLAAPQIGVDLQLVIFGTDAPNPRYPDAPLVPRTVLLNPVITPIGTRKKRAGKAASRSPACAAWCRAGPRSATPASTVWGRGRSHGRGLPRPRRATRMRPPDRQAVSHASSRLHQVRLHGRALP